MSLDSLDHYLDKVPELEPDEEVPAEVLEFFVPEVEEHLQAVTDCLLALEANPNEEDIHRLFRSMHTIKGSAAQVGWQRIATIAHRAEDLVGRLRDGELQPSATIIDLCLETVDVLKKVIYRQWEDEAGFQLAARMLIARLDRMASAEVEVSASVAEPAAETVAGLPMETHPIESAPNEAGAEAAALESRPSRWKLPSQRSLPRRRSRRSHWVQRRRGTSLSRRSSIPTNRFLPSLHRTLPHRLRAAGRSGAGGGGERGSAGHAGFDRQLRAIRGRQLADAGGHGAIQVGAHCAGAAGPHDECGGRTGDQSHPYVGSLGGVGEVGRGAELLQGPHER